jgi:hypothetical protein
MQCKKTTGVFEAYIFPRDQKEGSMKTIQKVCAAMALTAIIGLVGCGDGKKTEQPAKSPAGHDHGGYNSHTGPASHDQGKTEAQKTEPMEGEQPKKVEPALPDNTTNEPANNEAESGSGEKKNGVTIPNEAESGSGEKKGGVNIPE